MISIDVKGVKQAMLRLPDIRKVRRAASMALNRTGKGVVTEMDRGIREEYTIKRADVRDGVKSYTASESNLRFQVSGTTRKISLVKFQHRASRTRKKGVAGVRVRVKKAGGLKPVVGAFPGRMKAGAGVGAAGNMAIFKRVGRTRLPIKRLTGPSVFKMADNDKVRRRMEKRATDQFDREFTRNLDRLMKRR
ncbi:MAG: phage tail protein [bacterium]|nr:phage tail protein [bacterium]